MISLSTQSPPYSHLDYGRNWLWACDYEKSRPSGSTGIIYFFVIFSQRLDGRGVYDYRQMQITFGEDRGCCQVELGNTMCVTVNVGPVPETFFSAECRDSRVQTWEETVVMATPLCIFIRLKQTGHSSSWRIAGTGPWSLLCSSFTRLYFQSDDPSFVWSYPTQTS